MHSGEDLLPPLPDGIISQIFGVLPAISVVETPTCCFVGGEQAFMDHLTIGAMSASSTSKQREIQTAYHQMAGPIAVMEQKIVASKEEENGPLSDKTKAMKRKQEKVGTGTSTERCATAKAETKQANRDKKAGIGTIQWLRGRSVEQLAHIRVDAIMYGEQPKES